MEKIAECFILSNIHLNQEIAHIEKKKIKKIQININKVFKINLAVFADFLLCFFQLIFFGDDKFVDVNLFFDAMLILFIDKLPY